MKMSRFLTAIALVLVLVFAMTSCNLFPVVTEPTTQTTPTQPSTPGPGVDPTPDHTCESVCPVCGLCLNAECTEEACADKCAGHQGPGPVLSTPVITVVPEMLEINAGDDIDLMFGVSVSDTDDESPRLIIEDDDGFDADVEGEYTITYLAVNVHGNEARATRTVIVNKALSALSLEVRLNRLGETKWQGVFLQFKNKEYVELTGDTTLDAVSGVFHNTTDADVVLSIGGQYGVAAIINANGVVIEGRDGANSKFVNAANPVRDTSSATTLTINGETVSVSSAFAKEMVIPAGGYAIVVQNGYCGTTVDSDGRGFMNYNVIYMVGNVVRLSWADTAEVLTPYVDQAPTITGNGTKIFAGTSEFDLATKILEGVVATDDNGTFETSDDAAITVTIKDNGGFDINKQAVYTITLEATDGTHTTVVTREVEVTTETVEVKVNDKAFSTLKDLIAVDEDLTVLGKYIFVVYTPNYTGKLNWTNGWGEAFIINKYGEVVRIYDGANGKYYDADNKAGIVDATKCTAGGYLAEAFASRQEGEYLLVAPNGTAGNATRAFLLGNRTIGAKITLPGITFAAHECESKCAKCGGCLDEACAEAACATKCSCHVCESVCAICGKCTDAECTEEVCASKCEGHDVPAHVCESVCEHCGKCKDAACTEEVCASKCAGHENSKFITINGKTFEAVDGKWAYNTEITTSNAATKAVWIFDKSYTGNIATNAYGAAIVLDSYGRLVKVYDGANLGFYRGSDKEIAHFTTANYAVTAWNELEASETLIIFPNDGGSNAARGWALGLRGNDNFGKVATITGMEFDSATKTITVNGKTFSADLGLWAYNEAITDKTAASKRMWIFDKNYTGTIATNAYGAAIVINQYGQLVKVYDGANLGFYQGNDKETAHFTTANYAVTAWNELKDGEILIILPNDGVNGADSPRTFGLSLRGNDNFGKVVTLTGFRFESPSKTITIGSKTYTAELGKWLYNTAVTRNTTANYAIIIYDKGFTGTFTTNDYGVALVLTAEGKVARVYDGANAGYTDATSGVNNKEYGVTASNFATLAWESLQEGETLVILPNGGSEGNAARQVGLDCRWLIGQKMSITGFSFQ